MMRDKSCLGMDVWEDNDAWSVTDGSKMDEVGLSREQAVHPASALVDYK